MLCLIIITIFSEYSSFPAITFLRAQFPGLYLEQGIFLLPRRQAPYPVKGQKSTWLTLTTVPPLGVFLISGCGVDFWINVLLTILG